MIFYDIDMRGTIVPINLPPITTSYLLMFFLIKLQFKGHQKIELNYSSYFDSNEMILNIIRSIELV